MRQQSDPHQFATNAVLVGCISAVGMTGCAWAELKEKGDGILREHQNRRCREDPPRQLANGVTL